jgi:acyl dehydratase
MQRDLLSFSRKEPCTYTALFLCSTKLVKQSNKNVVKQSERQQKQNSTEYVSNYLHSEAGSMTEDKKVWPHGAPTVGQRAERTREVLPCDIELFTDISGDRNPLHYDEELAKATKFGEIIVQGGITSAILNAVVAEELPGPGTVFLHVDWSFKAPVRPGDKITGAAEVLKVRADKPVTELKTTVTRDDGTVALEGKALCYTVPLPRAGSDGAER